MEVYRVGERGLHRIAETEIAREKNLEEFLIRSNGAEIGGVEILYVDQQGAPGEGGVFDILGIDEQGDLVIIELKRGRTPRDMVAQALEYAASIRNEGYGALEERYRGFTGEEERLLRSVHTEFFDRVDDPLSEREFNSDQRLLLVGKEFSDLALDMADFLREHTIDVICVTYSTFRSDDGLQLLTTENIRRPLSEEPESVSRSHVSKSRECTVDLIRNGEVVNTFEARNQSEAMETATNYLIEEHDLLDRISIPYLPGTGSGDRALINDSPMHPTGDEMGSYRELQNGYYVLTKLDGVSKNRYLDELAEHCDLNARLNW